ncbi:MAG: response regulator [Paucibacter sp.]|nr:response regulator [Roseateles sp.]
MKTEEMSRLQVLVVNPAVSARYQTLHLLRGLSVGTIHAAANGEEALPMARLRRPDLVLSEWDMPDMDGLALLKAMRGDPQLTQMPLVLVTADVDRSLVEQAVMSGVSDLLVKPYTLRRLEDKILGAVRRGVVPSIGFGATPAEASSPAAEKPVLLVVDDTPDNLRLIVDLFADEYRVKVADSGEKALKICAGPDVPDLVLLDVMMPGMDGYEVARRLRELPQGDAIPVIFVTALDDDASKRRGFDVGAVDFVAKPIDPDLMRLRVRNFMRWLRLHKQRQLEYDRMLADARREAARGRLLQEEVSKPLQAALEQASAWRAEGRLHESQRAALDAIEQGLAQALKATQGLQET